MLRSGLLSAFILTTFSRPAHAAATPSSTESSTWHGRLQAAEKSDQDRLLPPQHFRLEIRFANFDDGSVVWIRVHILDCISDLRTWRLQRSSAKVAGVAGRIGQVVRTNSLLPNQPAGSSTPRRGNRVWIISARCPSRCRVIGLKLVFDLRTAGSNFTSPSSAIGIFFWLGSFL